MNTYRQKMYKTINIINHINYETNKTMADYDSSAIVQHY